MPRTKGIFNASLFAAVLAIATAAASLTVITTPASAEIAARPGWVITPTTHKYLDLTQLVANAAKRHKISVVAVASATVGVELALQEKIPGNMVIGLYHPRFAKRTLAASIPAGIEAPIRIYITENADGTATISYKKPSFVFAPYMEEGGAALKELATELDALFDSLVKDAATPLG
ncbi:MAG: DUF302 domain-containing protein [Rhizobiales bacterium]|nr:DUF302 domain-containing protein [Hyphomicrobiales bacterium]